MLLQNFQYVFDFLEISSLIHNLFWLGISIMLPVHRTGWLTYFGSSQFLEELADYKLVLIRVYTY